MRIVSISVLDTNFTQLFFNQLESKLHAKHMITISAFINALHKLGNDEFKGNLTRIDFRNLWFDFLNFDKYWVILIIKVEPDKIQDELLKYNKYVEDLHTYINKIITSNDFSFNNDQDIQMFNSLIKMYLSMFTASNEKRFETIIEEKEFQFKWSIESFFVCETSGIPIISRQYSKRDFTDPVLLSSMLSSIDHFANIEFNKKIERIHIGNVIVYFHHGEELLYVATVKVKSDKEKYISPQAERRIMRLLQSVSEGVNLLLEDEQTSNSEALIEVLDSYMQEITMF